MTDPFESHANFNKRLGMTIVSIILVLILGCMILALANFTIIPFMRGLLGL